MENNNNAQNVVHGFKVFKPDWSCTPNGNAKQYTCPGYFEEEGKLVICEHGMHFCQTAADCFNYYNFDSNNKVAEVIAYGEVLTDGNKSCTNKLEIVREIPWDEVLRIVNIGKNCTGCWNTGNLNTGDRNTGSGNAGHRNTGAMNTGSMNTGDYNAGNLNTGSRNTGDMNTGNRNTGTCNTGNRNIGDSNAGDWNKSSFNTGCFNTEEQKLLMFNKPSNMTYRDWLHSEARRILDQIPNESKYIQIWWNVLSDREKKIIKSIPNFESEIFFQCTGIRVDDRSNRKRWL